MIQYRAGIFHKKIIKKELKFFHKVKNWLKEYNYVCSIKIEIFQNNFSNQ